jgi:integrase/recombinase XerD
MRLYPEAAHKFVTDPTSGLKTDSSKKTYKATLRALQFAYPEHQLDQFTETNLVDWCSRTNLAPATVAGYKTRLQGFFGWALWRGLLVGDPSANMGRIVKGSNSKPVRENHWLTTRDVTRVLDSIDTQSTLGLRDMIIARLGFTLGLRRAEIAGLTWNQIDLDRQQLRVVGKGGKLAALFLTDSTIPWFEKWHATTTAGLGRVPDTEPVIPAFQTTTDFVTGWQLDVQWSRPVSPDAISKRVSFLSERAGTEFAPHDLRRSFANMLEEAGYTIEEISVALRHSDLGTTARYLERRQDAAYQTVKKKGLTI